MAKSATRCSRTVQVAVAGKGESAHQKRGAEAVQLNVAIVNGSLFVDHTAAGGSNRLSRPGQRAIAALGEGAIAGKFAVRSAKAMHNGDGLRLPRTDQDWKLGDGEKSGDREHHSCRT